MANRRTEEESVRQVKHTLQFPEPLWVALERRSRMWGMSKTGVIRRAIWLLTYTADHMDQGGELVVRYRDGREERVVIPPY